MCNCVCICFTRGLRAQCVYSVNGIFHTYKCLRNITRRSPYSINLLTFACFPLFSFRFSSFFFYYSAINSTKKRVS